MERRPVRTRLVPTRRQRIDQLGGPTTSARSRNILRCTRSLDLLGRTGIRRLCRARQRLLRYENCPRRCCTYGTPRKHSTIDYDQRGLVGRIRLRRERLLLSSRRSHTTAGRRTYPRFHLSQLGTSSANSTQRAPSTSSEPNTGPPRDLGVDNRLEQNFPQHHRLLRNAHGGRLPCLQLKPETRSSRSTSPTNWTNCAGGVTSRNKSKTRTNSTGCSHFAHHDSDRRNPRRSADIDVPSLDWLNSDRCAPTPLSQLPELETKRCLPET